MTQRKTGAVYGKSYTRQRYILNDNQILTITGRVSVGGGEAGRTGDPLPHAVAHVAARGRHQVVRHEARAVPDLFKHCIFPALF